MQPKSTPIKSVLFLAALAAAPLTLAQTTAPDAQDPKPEAASARLEALIDPRAQDQERAEANLDALVGNLLNVNAAGLVLLGEDVGPALRKRAEKASFSTLTSNLGSNPLRWMLSAAPMAALGYFESLERSDPKLFDALTRSEYSFASLLDRFKLADATSDTRSRVADLTARALGHETLLPSERDKIVRIALSNSLLDERFLQYCESRLAESESARRALTDLLNDKQTPLTEELTLRVLESLSQCSALTENEAAGIRSGLISRWRASDSISAAHIRAAIELIARTDNESLKRAWSRKVDWLVTKKEHAIAILDGAYSAEGQLRETLQKSALMVLLQLPIGSPARAEAVLDIMGRDDASQAILDALSQSDSKFDRSRNQQPHLAQFLMGLPSSRIPDAVRWLSATDLTISGFAFHNVILWPDGSEQLRSILKDESKTPTERVLSAAGLIGSEMAAPQDVAYIAALISKLASNPNHEAVAARALKQFYSKSQAARLAWSKVTAALMEDEKVPNKLAAEASLLVDSSTPESMEVASRVLRAAAARQEQSQEVIPFRNVRHFGLDAIAQAPELAQPALLRPWIDDMGSSYERTMEAVEAAGDPELSELLLHSFTESIRSDGNIYRTKQIADAIFQMAGPEPVEALIQATLESSNKEFIEHVESRISSRLSLKRAAAEWSRLASGGDSRGEAVTKVLLMLDHENKDVRIEAIHGLGTLGAVETLPRLIELVASGEPEIKAAALATLRRLRDKPAK